MLKLALTAGIGSDHVDLKTAAAHTCAPEGRASRRDSDEPFPCRNHRGAWWHGTLEGQDEGRGYDRHRRWLFRAQRTDAGSFATPDDRVAARGALVGPALWGTRSAHDVHA